VASELAEEAYEILGNHCVAMDKLVDEMKENLLKLHREKCDDKSKECEDHFMLSCLISLESMIMGRRKTVDPRLN
jgi:hypothetical protein